MVVNFKLGDKCDKDEIMNMKRAFLAVDFSLQGKFTTFTQTPEFLAKLSENINRKQ